MWFGAKMADLRNKNVFKCVLQVLILSQKHILGVKKVVWGGLDVVWGVSTDRRSNLIESQAAGSSHFRFHEFWLQQFWFHYQRP